MSLYRILVDIYDRPADAAVKPAKPTTFVLAAVIACAHTVPDEPPSAPANTERTWLLLGPASFTATPPTNPSAPHRVTIDPRRLPGDGLAHALRARRVANGQEYALSTPDTLLAARVRDLADHVPRTFGGLPTALPAPAVTLAPRTLFDGTTVTTNNGPGDERVRVSTDESGRYPYTAVGYLSNGCVLTLIGPSTALTAAHCVYDFAAHAYVANTWIRFGENNATPDAYTETHALQLGPFAEPSDLYDSLSVPELFITATDWNYDFAVLEFFPKRGCPGETVGWYGTFAGIDGPVSLTGYPVDKDLYSMWTTSGTYAGPGSWGTYIHYLDVLPGNSGGCLWTWIATGSSNPSGGSYRCSSIQSTQPSDGPNGPHFWNEARRWDAISYAFVEAHAHQWPPSAVP